MNTNNKKYVLNLKNIIDEINTGEYDQNVSELDSKALFIINIISDYDDFDATMLMNIEVDEIIRAKEIIESSNIDIDINLEELVKAETLKKYLIRIRNTRTTKTEELF